MHLDMLSMWHDTKLTIEILRNQCFYVVQMITVIINTLTPESLKVYVPELISHRELSCSCTGQGEGEWRKVGSWSGRDGKQATLICLSWITNFTFNSGYCMRIPSAVTCQASWRGISSSEVSPSKKLPSGLWRSSFWTIGYLTLDDIMICGELLVRNHMILSSHHL